MKIKFTNDEISEISSIINQYRTVSSSISDYQEKAKDIQSKVLSLEDELNRIKDNESVLMTELHKKYGDFSLQDVYETVYDEL